MWSIITAVAVFIYHSVCEYVLFLVIDLIFKGPLDKATSEKDLGVLWALEGSVLLLFSLVTALVSHRPLLLSVLTGLTFLYSLLKYDDSLKELLRLGVRLARWADSRFFLLRCLARRQWRRWRLKVAMVPLADSSPAVRPPVARPGRFRACGETDPVLAGQRTPRIGPAQLFSASGLARTEPPMRRWEGPASRFTGTPVGRLRIDDDDEEDGGWRRTALDVVKAAGHAVAVVAQRLGAWSRRQAEALLSGGPGTLPPVRPPRGLRHCLAGRSLSLNPVLQLVAHCPLLHATLNRLRPSFGCSVDQEALFTALLPVVNALAAAGEEEEDEEEWSRVRPVNAREVHEIALALLGPREAVAEVIEVLLLQLHLTCKDIDRFPRLRSQVEMVNDARGGLKDETVCRQQLDAAYRELLQLLPPTCLSAALAAGSPHRRQVDRIADLAFLAAKWRSGHSELRQLFEVQCVDVGLCSSCGRLCVAATTVTLLRLLAPPPRSPAQPLHLAELVRRSLAESGGVCTSLRCPCGASESGAPSAGLLSPIAAVMTPSRPPCTPGSTSTAHTSTPVPGRRCRADGNCCRRFLRRLPPCLLLLLPAGDDLLPPVRLDLADGALLPGDASRRFDARAVLTEDGRCFVRRGERWFQCEDELVRGVEFPDCGGRPGRLVALEQR